MKRGLIVIAILCSVALLAGCSQRGRFGNDPDIVYSTNHLIEPPLLPGKYGGSISGSFPSDPKTFNLWVATDASSSALGGMLTDALETRDPVTLKFIPRLAALPKVSADGLTYTYTLRPNLKWSDGYPLNADDIIFTLDLIFNPAIQTPIRESLLIDVPQPGGGTKREPFQYKKIDDRTVQFVLPIKYAPAENNFGFPIAPKHTLDQIVKDGQFNSSLGIDTPPSKLVGCGPFNMVEYSPQQRIVFKRNPYYWKYGAENQQLPYLDTFDYEIAPDITSTVLSFRSGECDALDVPAMQYPPIAKYARRDNYTLIDCGADWGFSYFAFNMNPNSTMNKTPALLKLFRNETFRQACSYAIDRQAICNSIFLGLAHPLWSPETPADVRYFDPNVQQYPYNPAKAKQMLLSIGMTTGPDGMLQYDGQPVKFNIITNVENKARSGMANIITNSLRNIGLDATFTAISFNKLITDVDGPPYDWQCCVLGFTGGPEPNDGSVIWRSDGPYHQWWPQQTTPATPWEARIDHDFILGARELDLAKRKKYYNDWQETLGVQQPFVFLVYQNDFAAMRNHYANVKPTSGGGLGGGVFWNMDELFDTHATRMTP